MKAAMIHEFGKPLGLVDIAPPTCPPDGVVIDVRACGVCRSDWHAWTGADPDVQLPHIPGHEFAGVVVEVGTERHRFSVGDRVTAPFVLGCGQCDACQQGEATICDTQETIGFSCWGAFAERIAVPRADFNLASLPDSVDDVSAAGLGCRVTTAFRALVDRAELQPTEWLAVHGCGGVGLSAILIAKALGARVVAIDIANEKLALAQSLGADATINASQFAQQACGEAVRDATGGGAHVAIDALGITDTFLSSLHSLRKMGRHVQIGMPLHEHATVPLPLLELVYARQISLHGTRGMPPQRFPTLFDWITSGRLNIQPLVTRTIPLEEASTVLAEMNNYQGLGITVIDLNHQPADVNVCHL